jgi:hypothetical protein
VRFAITFGSTHFKFQITLEILKVNTIIRLNFDNNNPQAKTFSFRLWIFFMSAARIYVDYEKNDPETENLKM